MCSAEGTRPVRVSVSKVAAIAGLHPFVDGKALQDIFDEALYQDAELHALDCATLGVSLRTEQQVTAEMVASLVHSSLPAVREVGAGMVNVLAQRADTNEMIGSFGQQAGALVERAVTCGAVPKRTARRLESALRSAINTEFGTRHEDHAVRLYERQTGCEVVESNEHLLLWDFPADHSLPPAPVRRVPLRPRRKAPLADARRGGGDGCPAECGGAIFRAIDRCRAALAVERREEHCWFAVLRVLDPEAQEADYYHSVLGDEARRWDVLGLMSDLRIARGRSLLAALREEARQRQRAQSQLHKLLASALGDHDGAADCGAPEGGRTDGSSNYERQVAGGCDAERHAEALPTLRDYCHGGDRWDVHALRSDLAIERCHRRRACAALAARGGSPPVESEERAGGCGAFYLAGAVDGVCSELVPPPLTDTAATDRREGEDNEGWSVRRVVVEVKNRVGSIKTPPPFYEEVQLTTYCLMLDCEEGDLVQCLRQRTGEHIHVSRLSVHAEPTRHAQSWHTHVRPRLHTFAAFVHRMRHSRVLRYRYLLGGPAQRRSILVEGLPHLSDVLEAPDPEAEP